MWILSISTGRTPIEISDSDDDGKDDAVPDNEAIVISDDDDPPPLPVVLPPPPLSKEHVVTGGVPLASYESAIAESIPELEPTRDEPSLSHDADIRVPSVGVTGLSDSSENDINTNPSDTSSEQSHHEDEVVPMTIDEVRTSNQDEVSGNPSGESAAMDNIVPALVDLVIVADTSAEMVAAAPTVSAPALISALAGPFSKPAEAAPVASKSTSPTNLRPPAKVTIHGSLYGGTEGFFKNAFAPAGKFSSLSFASARALMLSQLHVRHLYYHYLVLRSGSRRPTLPRNHSQVFHQLKSVREGRIRCPLFLHAQIPIPLK